MNMSLARISLDAFGLIGARGPGARSFLQGQLSQDVLALGTARVALAGLHNAQGRALAILRLVPLDDEDLLLLLPAELVAATLLRLRRFVLRAKLTLADESAAWVRAGLVGPGAAAALAAAGLAIDRPEPGALARHDGRIAWRHGVDPERFIVIAPLAAGLPADWPVAADPVAAARAWQAADLAAGLPQVRAATSEAFVAQMLNLDLLDGVSFSKGCYTGQEVIARAHYRGRVKRRLQRFRTRTAVASVPAPGDSLALASGGSARVVEALRLPDGRIEFLAVAPLAAGAVDEAAAVTGTARRADAGGGTIDAAAATGTVLPADPDATGSGGMLEVETLPLPYALPD